MEYLKMISDAAEGKVPNFEPRVSKHINVSVTGSAEEVAQCYLMISALQGEHQSNLSLMMEINLSCPNIPHKPPPAYSKDSLVE
jgi:dihydroorotate dehydrogenase (fumarate)